MNHYFNKVRQINERYKFDEILLIYTDQRDYRSGLKIGQVFDLINIEYDGYTDTKQLSDAKDKIMDYLKKQGFAFVSINNPKIEINRKNKKIKAIYEIVLNGKTIIDKTIINIKSKKWQTISPLFYHRNTPFFLKSAAGSAAADRISGLVSGFIVNICMQSPSQVGLAR